tara:strand:+ start:99 stop:851 length:753 start_codon:yes stop_codon:yes gene_type:complete
MDLFFLVCFFAGILSFLSPCVLPIVPSYLCYIAGITIKDINNIQADSELRNRVTIRSIYFVCGFSIIFISMGASVSLLRPLFNSTFNIFEVTFGFQQIAGLIILFFGIHVSGFFRISVINRSLFYTGDIPGKANFFSFLLGISFGFGWTPCIGPILATILTLAAIEETTWEGVWLLVSYSSGLGLPFIISGMMIARLSKFIRTFSKYIKYIEVITGLILIMTGLAFIFGWIQEVAFFLLENFQILSMFGI